MKTSVTGSNLTQSQLTRVTGSNCLHQPANLSTVAALAAANKCGTSLDVTGAGLDNLPRDLTANSVVSKMNPSNLMQHITNPLTLQLAARRKAQASGIVGPSASSDGLQALGSNFVNPVLIHVDHPPVELPFANEPIEIQLSKEAEAEANSFFQKLLKNISPPEEMFKTVYEYATQGNASQLKLLDGILRMLADEVTRHLQDYPETMLPLIADLYGSILAASSRLFSMRALSMLWRAVLARLYLFPPETSIDSPLFRAVLLILAKAKNTFTQFSNLPSCLVSAPVFKLFPHDLQDYIINAEMLAKSYTLSQQSRSKVVNTTSNQLGQLAGHYQATESISQSVGLTLTTYTITPTDLITRPPEPPEESISDRIAFLFNNVSKTNVKEKSTELVTILSEERLLPWFACYLVNKRIPVEQTFHDLFALVLDYVHERIPNVRPKVMCEVIRSIKKLLRNIRIDKDDMQARSALKNFGSFLGLITLARNKPLLHDDLNIKDLIYEAYYKGPIPTQYVVPFVARVVRGATESTIFRPPNPWTMAILKVLRELYDMENVKGCLRFEIEILYRAFEVNLNDIPSAHFLRDLTYASNLEIELCFIGPATQTTIPNNATAPITGVDSTLYTAPISSAPDLSGTAVTSALTTTPLTSQQQQQRQMLNMLAMLQKQQYQQASSSLNQPNTSNVDSTNVSSGQQGVYSVTALDLANLVQNSSTSNTTSNRQMAAAVAAAAAALQQPKQQQQPQQQFSSTVNGSTSQQQLPSTGPSVLSLQQQQIATAVATLQQQQTQLQHSSQNAVPSNTSISQIPVPQHSTTGANTGHSVGDLGGNMFGGHLLRYEDVSKRSIRACLNLDELFANAAVSGCISGNNASGTSAAFALLQANPRLRALIEPAVIRAIDELTTPVFERCARITVTTVAAIVRKDFALNPDPVRMLYAAHQMIRHLAAGMSLITAREALGVSLITGLKNIILAEVQSASGQEKEAVQQLAHLVVDKSMHVCLAYMQKSVAEKAVEDVEKKLEVDLKLRTELGPKRFLEKAVSQLAAQQSSMPESLRLTPGSPTPAEMAVYEEFGRVIPGFAPTTTSNLLNVTTIGQPSPAAMNSYFQLSASQKQQLPATGILPRQIPSTVATSGSGIKPPTAYLNPNSNSQQALTVQPQTQYQAPLANLFDKIISQIERHLIAISSRLRSANDPVCQSLRCLIDSVHLAKTNRDANVAANVISTMVQSFLEHYKPSFWRDQPRGLETMERLKEAHMLTLRHMLSLEQAPFGYAWVTRQVTQTWIRLDNGPACPIQQVPVSTGNSVNSSTGDASQTGESESITAIEKQSPDVTETGPNSWTGVWKQSKGSFVSQDGLSAIKWNWEAFAELLRVHVVYLSQVDAYLAQEVAKGHPGAITFVIDLLDHFVLPCPSGTSLGAAAAAAATFARVSASVASSQSTTSSGAASSVNNPPTVVNYSVPTVGSSQTNKREFTVLNEYDLWATLEAMRNRAASMTTASVVSDPLGLRLRLACARIRGLLDLGLMEHSPLFLTSPSTIGALYSGCSQAHEFDDPPNLQERVELLMRNWVEIYQSPKQRDPGTIETLLNQLTQIGVLPNLNNLTRFLRLATIFVVERTLKQLKLQEQQQQISNASHFGTGGVPGGSGSSFGSNQPNARVAAYVELDAYARLVTIIINQMGEVQQGEFANPKVALLNKVLGLIAGTLLQEHEVRRDWFHPLPFERILVMLFVELQSPAILPVNQLAISASHSDGINDEGSTEHVTNGNTNLTTHINDGDKVNLTTKPNESESIENKVSSSSIRNLGPLTMQQQLPLIFCHLLHCLRPEKATAFVFAWLEMLAHRWFISRILAAPGPPKLRAAYQAMYAQLLVDLLKFLGYFLQNALMSKPIQCLYKATLRLLLVLIHDFPEFVSDYYALFCDVVPSNSIQMRSLILSALPKRGIPSADPLQAPPVDHLASLEDPTGYCMDAGSRLPEPMRRELDAYLTSRAPVKLLSELVTMLRRADDIFPSLPPHFAYHPQQHARHQQALAAYAAALTVNNPSSTANKTEDRNADENSSPTTQIKPTTKSGNSSESWDSSSVITITESYATESSGTSTTSRPTSTTSLSSSVGSSSSAAAATLLWGVRATQQLATFGLADNMHYNIELMTNLTLYVCITAIRSLREKGMPLNMSTIAHTPQMDIIQSLVLNLDNEGRYLFLNCMANQLRYPNSHTYYFSYTILYLFSEQSKEQVKEQISRVLMERLIVNRPHPWGLLMTSAELLRNPAYRFWEHEFARCNPEIEAIFTIVARSCIPNFQIPSLTSTTGATTNSAVSSSLRNALSSSITQNRRPGSPISRGATNVTGLGPTNVSTNPTPLLTE